MFLCFYRHKMIAFTFSFSITECYTPPSCIVWSDSTIYSSSTLFVYGSKMWNFYWQFCNKSKWKLFYIFVSKFIFIWTTKNLHNRFWMNAKGFSHSGIIRAESRTYFVLYIFLSACYTTTTDTYLDVRWAVSLYYTNVLIQMTHLHSNVLQLAIEFSEIIYVYSVWHVDLKLIQIFIFVAIFIVLGYVQCWSWIKICAKRNIHNITIEGWICTFREQNNRIKSTNTVLFIQITVGFRDRKVVTWIFLYFCSCFFLLNAAQTANSINPIKLRFCDKWFLGGKPKLWCTHLELKTLFSSFYYVLSLSTDNVVNIRDLCSKKDCILSVLQKIKGKSVITRVVVLIQNEYGYGYLFEIYSNTGLGGMYV